MTGTPWSWAYQLAAADSFTHMGQRFQRHHSSWQVSHLLLLLFLILAAVIGAWLLSRYVRRRSGECNCPRALFAQLCHAHGLGWSARRLLSQLAGARGLSDPAQLFVEPQHFGADHVDGVLRPRKTELIVLRDTIFGAEWCKSNLGAG